MIKPQSGNTHPQSEFETPGQRQDFWRATFSCWLGTAMEYADFALYGLAAGIIFGDVFFPEVTPALALLSSFATWSVGFIARPIGALFFGWLGDRRGRKYVMVITIVLMGLSTTLIGLIPDYHTIGLWAPAFLVILRFTQGFGAGAELSGGTVMLGEYAPVKRRGLVSSVIALGSNSGTLLASLVWLLVVQLDHQSLLSWGWRIPFLSSVVIALGALWMRRSVRETPVFEKRMKQLQAERQQGRQDAEAGSSSLCRPGKAFWVMVGLRIGENGPSYLAQGFMVGYVAKVLMMDKSVPTTAVFIASLLGFLVIPLAGWLSDRYGRRNVYRVFCLLLMVYAWPAFTLLDTHQPWIVIATIVTGMGLASLGIFGVQAAWGVELFGVAHRYSKMAVAKELGSIISGGTAPLVAAALLSYYGNWWAIAVYFSLMAAIGFFTTFIAPETRGRDLNLPEDAI
ncbi:MULTISPECIES: MFS transporter [unclassified Tatumella]|uniref:MFS transporter n=1 Tax=unclassified Tatumella TaxID=2649542 RepID=UPI001BAE6AC0|nr:MULTISPECIES: MFS transporter [unclassified Tatumella]MBS0855251.1 MHS family MFS transporter [Tatumella sp. JGM16]MBS0876804.1 MHS family MFS transporter [Tatumella sp. JGM82]MBS0889771.1 MHS family MFS transporter [Tatumella sp. JGM94]MBS0901559.1 MHS family MFS transporter [Tatumella sp. JGM100]MBS0911808.1 MHS family MFS transporter [Tatumella sp. JGM91]